MNKRVKIIGILVIVILIMNNVFFLIPTYGQDLDIHDLQGSQQGATELKNVGNDIVKILSTIGVIVSVVVLIILGIKYMMGSVEEKAEYKKTLLPYIIGAALVFAASSIAQIVYSIAIKL